MKKNFKRVFKYECEICTEVFQRSFESDTSKFVLVIKSRYKH